jgi:ribosomal protein L16 Arg81 hydroxylase
MLDVSRGLEALLSPVSREVFLKEYWEAKPLLIERKASCFYDGLFSAHDLDQLISYSEMSYPTIRAVQNGKPEQSLAFARAPLSSDQLVNQITAAYDLYADGYTIVLSGIQRGSRQVRHLCRFLEAELSHPVTVNAYATPKGSQGFSAHYDDHDILILQIEGSKHWEVSPPHNELPLEWHPPNEQDQLREPYLTTMLEAGDMLYLPRGWNHAGRASEAASLHLTVGIFVYRWADFIQQAVRDVCDKDIRFRRALPPGFLKEGTPSEFLREHLKELLGALESEADAGAAQSTMARRLLRRSEPTAEKRLGEINSSSEINIETDLEKPAAMRCQVLPVGAHCSVYFPGGELRMPGKTTEALRFISEREGAFTGRQIPGPLRESEVLVLLRRLMKEGLLQRSAHPPASEAG